MKYLPGKKASALLGIHQNTLRKYADRGIIPSFKTASGQRRYDVDAYLNQQPDIQTVCYCRVSSNKQKDGLQRQTPSMQEQFPHAAIITDVAGGLNWQRKGLVSILERLHQGDKLQIVVAHRDRLARFGFELIQWLVERNGGAVLVLNQQDASPESELTHRRYSRHPPYFLLPAPRTPPLPLGYRKGSGSIPTGNRRKPSNSGLTPPAGATTRPSKR